MTRIGSLKEAIEIWSTISQQKRGEVSVNYPLLSTAIRSARKVRYGSLGSLDAGNLAQELLQILFTLRQTPVSPDCVRHSLDDIRTKFTELTESHPYHSQTSHLKTLCNEIIAVSKNPSPISAAFESLVSKFDRSIVITANRHQKIVAEYLETAELDGVEVVPIRKFKRSFSFCELVVIINDLGELDPFYPFITVAEERFRNSWILTDANTSNLVMVGDKQSLDRNKKAAMALSAKLSFETFPISTPDATCTGTDESELDPSEFEHAFEGRATTRFNSEESVKANIVRLQSQRILLFSKLGLHRPFKLKIEDDLVFREEIGTIEENDVIVIFGHTGSINVLREMAKTELELNGNGKHVDNAERIATSLKTVLRSKVEHLGREYMEAEIQLYGKSQDQARSLISSVLQENYIAPNKDNFATFAKVLGLKSEIEHYKSIEIYRNAIRNAGKARSDNIINFLNSHTSWRETLKTAGSIKFAEESIGIFHIEIVESFSTKFYGVPVPLTNCLCTENDLGQNLTRRGDL